MSKVAIGIFCKTPAAGRSKTRLSPPLSPDECGEISTCFIRDLAATIAAVVTETGDTPVAIYTPAGSEAQLKMLLAPSFELLLQDDGDFGARLVIATEQLLAAGHCGAILVNSDSPTLPSSLLYGAVAALKREDCVVLGPAIDGGYTLIGIARPHKRLFADIPWSTSTVYAQTVERANEIGLPVVSLPMWYDVDDADTLAMLERELSGRAPEFAEPGLSGAQATTTRAFMTRRRERLEQAGRA